MGFLGMAASGFSFLLMGLWQSFHLLLPPNNRSPSSFPLCSSPQSIAVAILSLIHIISGLLASHSDGTLENSLGFSVPLERSSVSLVFFIFAISNLLAQNTKILPLPKETLNMMVLYGLGQEFLLFYLQRPDSGLESRYYTLLLVPICACMISITAIFMFPDSDLAPLGLALGLVLQGTWMIQMAFSFFLKGTMAMDCSLRVQGEGDYVIKCTENHDNGSHTHSLMRAKAMATLQFNGHMAFLIIIMLSLLAFTRRFARMNNRSMIRSDDDRDGLNYEMVSTLDSDDRPNPNRDLTSLPPLDSFSLGVDDEEIVKKDASESYGKTNGFHG